MSREERAELCAYSVLMPVYAGETAGFFRRAIESMLRQSIPTDDFVIVCDGTLTEELDSVIAAFCGVDESAGIPFRVLRRPKEGLPAALNAGLAACRHELVCRMDSDDIACSDRCEKQLAAFREDPALCLLSGTIAEFDETRATVLSDAADGADSGDRGVRGQSPAISGETVAPEPQVSGFRRLPLTDGEIRRFAKSRNPMNHMAVMFRKSAVLEAGSYRAIGGFEDYDLWVRMLQRGSRARNLPDTLVYARTGNGMIRRRGGLSYVKQSLCLEIRFLRSGWIGLPTFLRNCLVRAAAAAAPAGLRARFYRKHLRSAETAGDPAADPAKRTQ